MLKTNRFLLYLKINRFLDRVELYRTLQNRTLSQKQQLVDCILSILDIYFGSLS